MTTDQTIEQEIQAKGLTQRSHVKCQGDRCMSINGRGHSRECIQEAARVQGWTPSEADFSECGPSAPITESSIEQKIKAKGKTAPRVTPADIEKNIRSENYFTAEEGVMCGIDVTLLTQEKTMETFIQPKITGYRQLSEHEVALMNEGKALAELCGAFIEKLRTSAPGEPSYQLLDQRWINIGATDLQRGFMAITRGIAQPTTF